MWPFNLCHDFRYGKIMYNQLDQFVGKSLRLYGEFSQGEANLFEQIVKPGHVVVEAGANIGAHTVHLAQLAGDKGQVWAFEPQRLVFQLLAGNVALNSLTNVRCLQKCLGDDGEKSLLVPVLDVNTGQLLPQFRERDDHDPDEGRRLENHPAGRLHQRTLPAEGLPDPAAGLHRSRRRLVFPARHAAGKRAVPRLEPEAERGGGAPLCQLGLARDDAVVEAN